MDSGLHLQHFLECLPSSDREHLSLGTERCNKKRGGAWAPAVSMAPL